MSGMWAFNFGLTNSHLFQQKLMPALHDNDITVTKFNGIIVKR